MTSVTFVRLVLYHHWPCFPTDPTPGEPEWGSFDVRMSALLYKRWNNKVWNHFQDCQKFLSCLCCTEASYDCYISNQSRVLQRTWCFLLLWCKHNKFSAFILYIYISISIYIYVYVYMLGYSSVMWMSEYPSVNENKCLCFDRVGQTDTERRQDIVLSGAHIKEEHCIFRSERNANGDG